MRNFRKSHLHCLSQKVKIIGNFSENNDFDAANFFFTTPQYTFFANFRLIVCFGNFVTKFTRKIQAVFFCFFGVDKCKNYILCSQNLSIFQKDKLLSIDKYFRISIPTLIACFCKREHLTVIVYAQCWAKNEKNCMKYVKEISVHDFVQFFSLKIIEKLEVNNNVTSQNCFFL